MRGELLLALEAGVAWRGTPGENDGLGNKVTIWRDKREEPALVIARNARDLLHANLGPKVCCLRTHGL
jgi:hypothetical protein